MDDTAYVRQWGEEMARLADAFSAGFEAAQGYPLGEHEVRLASAEEGEAAVALLGHAGAAEALLEYYARSALSFCPISAAASGSMAHLLSSLRGRLATIPTGSLERFMTR